MSKKRVYYLVDVFGERKYTGNQLAVFRNGSSYSDAEMQQIAREINFSETTFIMSETDVDGGFPVRIFTPASEMPFAGHPTLGTAFIIQSEIIKKKIPTLALNLKIGKIPVDIEYENGSPDRLTMKQIEPSFGKKFAAEELFEVLGLNISDIDTRFPIEVVSTGMPDIFVPLKTLEAIRKVRINLDKYYSLIENLDAKAIFVFAPETYDKNNQFNVRMFADYFGVPEDPATGSANGAFAGYLVKNQYLGSDNIDIRVEQGNEVGRPSLLYLKASKANGKIEIKVGGRAIKIAEGEWL